MPPDGYFTDKNGIVHPINNRRKGTIGGTAVAAAMLTGVLTAAGGADATTSIGAALDTAQSIEANTANAKKTAEKGEEDETWQRMTLRKIKQLAQDRLQCALQSYSQVQQFFLRTSCKSLKQRLGAFFDDHGDIIVVSINWVQMPSDNSAEKLLQVEDTYGTGDITPIATEALELGTHVKFTGQHYKSRRDGALVVVAETEALRGQPSKQLLDATAEVAAVFPPPP